ncbi:MAG: ATP-binding protein [Haloarculaceae archaeon]
MSQVPRWFGRRAPFPGWFPLGFVGALQVGVSIWNFLREIRTLGIGPGPLAAAALGVSLSAGVIYASDRLRRSDLDAVETWIVTTLAVGVGLLVGVADVVTVLVRAMEGRPVTEPVFPLTVAWALGTLAGVVLGGEHVALRRRVADAERTRDAMAFTNSLLRHDVRNGLQVIVGQAGLLKSHDDEAVGEGADTIEQEARALTDLVSRVESVTEVLAGDGEYDTADVATVLDDTVEAARESHPEATVALDRPDALPVAGADALRPVFTNLFENAVEHGSTSPDSHARQDAVEHGSTSPDSETRRDAGENGTTSVDSADRSNGDPVTSDGGVRIEVTATVDDEDVVVRVADDGRGVPEEARDRVFERGVSSDEGGQGLYIVDTLVETLGGSVRVEDSDLGGAAFVVTLPLDRNAKEGEDTPFDR